MKYFLLMTALYLLPASHYGQSDFLSESRSKICAQLNADDVRLYEVSDSLYMFLDSQKELKTKAYLNYWKALGFYHSSEQPLDSVVTYGNRAYHQFLEEKDKEGLFEVQSLLGKTLLYLSDWKGSQQHLNSARLLASDDFNRFRSYVDYGFKYVFEDKIDSAFISLSKAEKLLPKTGDESCWYSLYKTELNINFGMAEIRRTNYEDTDYDKAIKYFKRAINAYDLSENKGFENYLFCLINLSYSYRKGGFFAVKSIHVDSARVYLEEYIDLVENSDITDKYGRLESAYANLGWQLFAEGKADKGIYEVQRSRDYLDSMYTNLLDKKALEITSSFEHQLKDKEIAYLNLTNQKFRQRLLLIGVASFFSLILIAVFVVFNIQSKKKNRQLVAQQAKIVSMNNQLEMLLREIHHRIKNNLQVISSFLGIQKRELKQKAMISILDQSQARIQTIAVLHEQLYEQKGVEQVSIRPYFGKLVAHIKANMVGVWHIDFEVSVADCFLSFDKCFSFGIILNELITNAIKHAFKKENQNQIRLSFTKEKDAYVMEVSDNGSGMPKKSKKTQGMGLQIIDAMTQTLGGTLNVEVVKGTTVTLTVPH